MEPRGLTWSGGVPAAVVSGARDAHPFGRILNAFLTAVG
jgi:hypothetical protein